MVDLYRRVAGTDGLVATVTMSGNALSGDVFKLSASGVGATVTLKCYMDGVQQGSDISDSSTSPARITAAGQTGICSWDATLQGDDFLVEDLGPAESLASGKLLYREFPKFLLRRK